MDSGIVQHDELTFLLLAFQIGKVLPRTALQRQIQHFALQGVDIDQLRQLSRKLSRSSLVMAEEQLKQAVQQRVRILTIFESDYPEKLRHIDCPPSLLYCRGSSPLVSGIAIVGTRHCSEKNARLAHSMANDATKRGYSVVSGLAVGIDTAAHEGAIAACREQPTAGLHPGLAVLGSGFSCVYPAENRSLAEELIDAGGALLSEYPPDARPAHYTFPERNRIVAGISEAIVVVEAGTKSGALITARLGLEGGRDVFAVPGAVDSPLSEGCNGLIRDGAMLIRNFQDVIEGNSRFSAKRLGVEGVSAQCAKKPREGLPPRRGKVVPEELLQSEEGSCYRDILCQLQREGSCHLDVLVAQLNRSAQQVLSCLALLEIHEIVQSLPGGFYELSELVDIT